MKKIELSQKELTRITAALETQRKILQVQASAGETAAREGLNETKRILAHLHLHADSEKPRRRGLLQRILPMLGGFRARAS